MLDRVDCSKPKRRFLAGLSFIYLFAFSSFYIQLPGLCGDHGISPAEAIHLKHPSSLQDFLHEPNVIRLGHLLTLSAYHTLELCAVVGFFLSLLSALWDNFRTIPVYLISWLAYFTLTQAAPVFTWPQWDYLLLEAGFIAILLSKPLPFCYRDAASDKIAMWLLRWLLFRVVFSTGMLKLSSGCPSWWGLTALKWHYQSQGVPNPVAWYLHNLPEWIHAACAAIVLLLEVPLPLLFFIPLRGVRLFSFYSQVVLQLIMLSTGNLNFWNLLVIALSYSLLKNEDFPSSKSARRTRSGSMSGLLSLVLIVAILSSSVYLFNFTVSSDRKIVTSIGFTKEQFSWFRYHAVMCTMYIAVALFLKEIIASIFCALSARSGWRKMAEFVGVLIVGTIAVGLLLGSLASFAALDVDANNKLPRGVRQFHSQIRHYHVAGSHGLFRRMKGIGGRSEIIIEGSPTPDGPWTEYAFRFKPGPVGRIPPVILPHEPRVDRQMWAAALSTSERQQWLMNLIYRLLQQEPDVLELLDTSLLPKNPKFVRAELYTYHYTTSPKSKNWWHRERKSTYIPPQSLNSPALISAVKASHLIGEPRKRPAMITPVSIGLDRLREFIGQPPDLAPLTLVCVLLLITKCTFGRASASATEGSHRVSRKNW
ncbi:unnamed protein product [Calicophoron daubneyi]|uniref:Lipase maturation factor n=1 Tax=Calicophoron daubneyi TaxID=300641 RepID=A0AAV2TUP5_CALDB